MPDQTGCMPRVDLTKKNSILSRAAIFQSALSTNRPYQNESGASKGAAQTGVGPAYGASAWVVSCAFVADVPTIFAGVHFFIARYHEEHKNVFVCPYRNYFISKRIYCWNMPKTMLPPSASPLMEK
jgi:hypothetical protein